MTAVYAAGKIILFSEGEYSDYGYCGRVVTLKECNFAALAEEFNQQFKPKNSWDTPDPCFFVGWLCSQQYVAEINAEEIHLGSYGKLGVGGR